MALPQALKCAAHVRNCAYIEMLQLAVQTMPCLLEREMCDLKSKWDV